MPNNNSFIREDGFTYVAEDFVTRSGKKLSDQGSGGGSTAFADITGHPTDNTELASDLNAKENSLGFTPEDVSNKSTDGTLASDSDTLFPSEKAVKTYVDAHAGGGAAQSPLSGNHKAIANNASTDLFSFPLADGDGAGFTLGIEVTAKKDADIGVDSFFLSIAVFNVGGTLSKNINISGQLFSTVSTPGIIGMGNEAIDASLSAGVCTISINPGDVVSSPDSVDCYFVIHDSHGKTITFL